MGCRIHMSMDWPPNSAFVTTPINLVYYIPMALIYGPGILLPLNAANTLDLDVENIRREIAEEIL
jgi:hypothetical protein